MAAHAPHVRTKKPLRGRRAARVANRLASIRHALPSHRIETRLVRRGPPTGEREEPTDTTFRIGALGVVLAAGVLGVALGLAQPTWMLAAALLAAGALLATVVAFKAGARPVSADVVRA